ncbi:unnamed protein product, partial [Ectocarpus sp. 8 AP-2014]
MARAWPSAPPPAAVTSTATTAVPATAGAGAVAAAAATLTAATTGWTLPGRSTPPAGSAGWTGEALGTRCRKLRARTRTSSWRTTPSSSVSRPATSRPTASRAEREPSSTSTSGRRWPSGSGKPWRPLSRSPAPTATPSTTQAWAPGTA